MKKLVRKGVYETNSSSSHSVSIASDDKEFVLDTLYPDQRGIVTVNGDEFGWDWFKANDAETKASYVAQSYRYDDYLLETLKEVIMEQTGAEDVVFSGLDGGYVDHDSSGIAPTTKHEIRNFVFNKNSWLFGGNDNSSAAPDFYDVPEIRDGRMVMPEYKYELSFEGLKETVKFKEYPDDENIEKAINSLIGDASVTKDGYINTDNSIYFQISKPRNRYYNFSYFIEQDFSTGNVRLLLEDDSRTYEIRKRLEDEGKFEGIDWEQRSILTTKEFLKEPGLVKLLPFTIKEINNG
jgi:hypothetical protein